MIRKSIMIASLIATIAVVGLSAQPQEADALRLVTHENNGGIFVSPNVAGSVDETGLLFVNSEINSEFCGVDIKLLDTTGFTEVEFFFTAGDVGYGKDLIEVNRQSSHFYDVLLNESVAILTISECNALAIQLQGQ